MSLYIKDFVHIFMFKKPNENDGRLYSYMGEVNFCLNISCG